MPSKNTVNIIHLGPGKVGKTFLKILIKNREHIENTYRISLRVTGIFSSEMEITESNGLSSSSLNKIIQGKEILQRASKPSNVHALMTSGIPFILIDTTSSDKTAEIILSALKKGGFAVLSNKRPLCLSFDIYNNFLKSGAQRLFFETTVGAGLPVIETLKSLIETGDVIIELNGCLSGTLGFIFSQIENGMTFSESILLAKKMGYTESDPREDLKGMDVARKLLILSRLTGMPKEITDINLQALYPEKMNSLTLDNFINKIGVYDRFYQEKMTRIKKSGKTIRFIARIKGNKLSASLTIVKKSSDLGSLQGPDNLVMIKTKRYFHHPLIIKGPGAGLEVTAAGVLADILKIIKIIKGGIS